MPDILPAHHPLSLADYLEPLALMQPYQPALSPRPASELVVLLLHELLPFLGSITEMDLVSYRPEQHRYLLDQVLQQLPAELLSAEGEVALNTILRAELALQAVTESQDFQLQQAIHLHGCRLLVWQGELTALKAEAITCFSSAQLKPEVLEPNTSTPSDTLLAKIHRHSGVQLRHDCHQLLQLQGHLEQPQYAKITRAYNLPCRYLLQSYAQSVDDLNGCCQALLNLATQMQLSELVIGSAQDLTKQLGVTPAQTAASMISSVQHWLMSQPHSFAQIVFHAADDDELQAYQQQLDFLPQGSFSDQSNHNYG